MDLEQAFGQLCRKLKLRRIDEQLTHIQRVTRQLEGASELTEETRRLQGERVDLLALRKKVLSEG
jgi:DNA primase